ncbi:MAG: STAS domain-containing protein [Thermoguttaceae bacterium]|jgi:anti-sigma B factor antagonist
MSLQCIPSGEFLTILLTDAKILDAPLIEQIHQEMAKIIGETEQRNVILDFREVKFLSSAALGMLILVNKMCKEYKINLKLCNIEPDIAQIFKITGMNKVFAIYKTAEDVHAAFQKEGLIVQK